MKTVHVSHAGDNCISGQSLFSFCNILPGTTEADSRGRPATADIGQPERSVSSG
jgi:hypothetical protein